MKHTSSLLCKHKSPKSKKYTYIRVFVFHFLFKKGLSVFNFATQRRTCLIKLEKRKYFSSTNRIENF